MAPNRRLHLPLVLFYFVLELRPDGFYTLNGNTRTVAEAKPTVDTGHRQVNDSGHALSFTSELRLQKASETTGTEVLHATRAHMVCAPTDAEACGPEGKCCCKNGVADCSSRALRAIANLSSSITNLDFSGNMLGVIDNSTLNDATHLIHLNLNNNSISSVHPLAFKQMGSLTRLAVAHNNLTDLDGLLTALGEGCPQLRDLNASVNGFRNLTLGLLTTSLPQLTHVHLGTNNIHNIVRGKVGNATSNLTLLHLGSNLLRSIPNFCVDRDGDEKTRSLFPHLEELSMEWNIMTSLRPKDAHCLHSLRSLNLSGNSLHQVHSNFLQGFPRLETVALRFCSTRMMDSHAFNHSTIKYLDVSENLWFFDSQMGSGIDPNLFQMMPRLEFINISWSVFAYSSTHETRTVLSSLSHVSSISLRGMGLDCIPHIITKNFTRLQAISLSKNMLTYLPDDTFENLTSLTELDLSGNHMTCVSRALLGNITVRSNVSLDFSGNPFSCTCDLLWFIDEYRKDRQKQKGGIFVGDNYNCSGPEMERGKNIADCGVTADTCKAGNLDRGAFLAVVFSAGFLVVLLLLSAVVYRFRWQLRFLMYSLQNSLTRDTPPGDDAAASAQNSYDIFVSYDSSDHRWVAETLRPELEDRRKLKLCLHERDFTPGMFISENITEKLGESKAMLAVMSNSFLTSDWCRFELSLATKIAFKHRCRRRRRFSLASSAAADTAHAQRPLTVLPVLLEELQQDRLDGLTLAVLTSTTYLAWPREGSKEEKERFWNTLCLVLTGSSCKQPEQSTQGASNIL